MPTVAEFGPVKLILSRKGFDSANGGVPSPIFPNGSMYSIPIRQLGATKRYADLAKGDATAGNDIGTVVEHLTRGRVRAGDLVHFDPDLEASALPRGQGWRPCFGQTGAARSHLMGAGVGPGDLFLFFGWFRRVLRGRDGRWRALTR
jgi:hypothetical protein